MKPEISIIVPVYKVEKYLKKCVDSILNQTFKDFELILVDDGSPDNCGKICDEYAHKDSRVKVIHKENGGLSSARNAGLDIAQGEYIGFVDSDDWIEPDMYEILYKLIKKYKTNISICGIRTVKKNINTYNITPKVNHIIRLKRGKEEVLESRYSDNWISWSCCNKLYSRVKIKGIRFIEGIIYEDVPFSIEVFNQISSYVYTDKKLYNYLQIGESITRNKISNKHLSLLKNTLYCYKITNYKYKQQTLNNLVDNCLFICISIVNEKTIIKNKELFKQMREILKNNKEILKMITYENTFKRISFKIIKFSPFLFSVLYRIGKEIKNIKK